MAALKGCDNLRVLELGYNPFGAEGMQHLAEHFKESSQVRTPEEKRSMLPICKPYTGVV